MCVCEACRGRYKRLSLSRYKNDICSQVQAKDCRQVERLLSTINTAVVIIAGQNKMEVSIKAKISRAFFQDRTIDAPKSELQHRSWSNLSHPLEVRGGIEVIGVQLLEKCN